MESASRFNSSDNKLFGTNRLSNVSIHLGHHFENQAVVVNWGHENWKQTPSVPKNLAAAQMR